MFRRYIRHRQCDGYDGYYTLHCVGKQYDR